MLAIPKATYRVSGKRQGQGLMTEAGQIGDSGRETGAGLRGVRDRRSCYYGIGE